MPILSFGQTESENSKKIAAEFEMYYNSGEYQKLFELFSPEMKNALPLDQTTAFSSNLKTQAGKITGRTFTKNEGGYALYKTSFEKAVLGLYISIDNKAMINGLFVKPFIEDTETNTVNGLQDYPAEIAEMIYSKSKDFPANTQLSIAIIKEGKTNYYGVINENGTLKSIENQNKVFEIGSITKVFTSTVLASLVNDKKIKLTDPINTFYPFSFKDEVNITFESLANHTSGLPRLPENLDLSNMANPYKSYNDKLLNEYLKNVLKPNKQPLEAYEYSNLGAGLLGHTLGLSQKKSFQELLKIHVFDKYKLSNSYLSSQGLDTELVKGLDTNGEIVSNWDFDVLFGAGGILSTTEDLAKFVGAHFKTKNKDLALTRKETFNINENMQIALGWHLLKSGSGQDLVWHNGGTGGYSSSLAMDVNNKTAVIILSNVSAFNPRMGHIDELCFKLMEQVNVED
ncbi:MAG: hypothetical protein Sapg2KO_07000 [Saprospiraceae bacterium]